MMRFRGGLAGRIEGKWGLRPAAGKEIGPLRAYRSRGRRPIGEVIRPLGASSGGEVG